MKNTLKVIGIVSACVLGLSACSDHNQVAEEYKIHESVLNAFMKSSPPNCVALHRSMGRSSQYIGEGCSIKVKTANNEEIVQPYWLDTETASLSRQSARNAFFSYQYKIFAHENLIARISCNTDNVKFAEARCTFDNNIYPLSRTAINSTVFNPEVAISLGCTLDQYDFKTAINSGNYPCNNNVFTTKDLAKESFLKANKDTLLTQDLLELFWVQHAETSVSQENFEKYFSYYTQEIR